MHQHDAGHSLFSLVQFARQMRKAPTKSEALLWAQLRGRKLGPRVRRQHPLHPFVVDFFVCAHRLAIEIDGGIHRWQREHDLARDRYLSSTYRVRVLRIDADVVERDVLAAVAIVRASL